jgi:DegV family protein with EDD domain
MQIVSDSGADISAPQMQQLGDFTAKIHAVPLMLTLNGKSYRSGIDIQPDEFYALLDQTSEFPTTSQPSPGDFADLYRTVAAQDKDILSIHISSGLSGTYNSARLGAKQVESEANITLYDTKTLSAVQGWHVVAAAKALQAGKSLEEVLPILTQISTHANSVFTVAQLKYLIHGGRISHMRGLLGGILDMKPIIAVEHTEGKYAQQGVVRSLKKALNAVAEHGLKQFPQGTPMLMQVMHANSPTEADYLREILDKQYQATWLPTSSIATVLGAHTGTGMIGVAYAPVEKMQGTGLL